MGKSVQHRSNAVFSQTRLLQETHTSTCCNCYAGLAVLVNRLMCVDAAVHLLLLYLKAATGVCIVQAFGRITTPASQHHHAAT
jgi:hypothetical protein